jgi:hypothetical protein
MMLQSIDMHVRLYLHTGDGSHLMMADLLRSYVCQLKDWIHTQEGRQ